MKFWIGKLSNQKHFQFFLIVITRSPTRYFFLGLQKVRTGGMIKQGLLVAKIV
jgi:hypothetical protein